MAALSPLQKHPFLVLVLLLITAAATGALGQSDSVFPSPPAPGDGHCVWYDECGMNPFTHRKANCPYSGRAKQLSAANTKVLAAICPELVQDIGLRNGSAATCCSATQITSLSTQMAVGLGLLQRCPSCVRNFRLTYCYMTCGPHQSNYMNVANTTINPSNNKTVITQLNFTMSESFAEGVYDSCKDVSMPSTNEKAMSVMCGPWGSYYCNADRWFNYMGSTKNGYAPFQIDYLFVNVSNEDAASDAKQPFTEEFIPCDQSSSNDSQSCSCSDCQQSCPMPPPPPPPSNTPLQAQLLCAGVGLGAALVWCCLLLCNLYGGTEQPTPSRDLWLHYKCPGRIGHKISAGIQAFFVKWGTVVGTHPWKVIVASILCAVALSTGVRKLIVTTDPVELWASPGSTSRQEKHYFDSNFEPFYRTEMLIIRPVGLGPVEQETPNGIKEWGPVYNKSFLKAVADLQNHIQDNIRGADNTTLSDICFKPMFPANDFCTIQSVMNYFQNDPSNLDLSHVDQLGYNVSYLSHLDVCFRNPVSPMDPSLELPCLGTYGGPVFPYTAVGGFLKNGSTDLGVNPAYNDATALVITFVVNNHDNATLNGPAKAWEKAFLTFMANYSHPLLDVAYSAERAVQDELERESQGDVFTILISYMLMFAYIVCSIGQFSGCGRLLVDSKVTLGLSGVLIVLVSVTAAIGVYALIGVPATLIIIEVIPFLVLAVGVDNMFLLVRAVQRAEKLPTETRPQQLGRVMGDAAPALLISTGSEAACFFLGALSPMPAVRAFALYAGLALTIDFLLQITCFLAIITLDNARQEGNRVDVLCCFKLRPATTATRPDDLLTRFMRNYYGKLLCKRSVKATVIVFFTLWSMTSIPFLTSVEIGLDQELSMPEDSYLLKYFNYLGHYLSVGPPVYFVLKPGIEFGKNLDEQNLVCGSVDCDQDSLVTQIYLASRIANRSGIARPASSWIDDYISWSMYNMGDSSVGDPCCRVYENGTFCPSTDFENNCNICNITFTDDGLRPTPESFNKYLPFFLEDLPSEYCPKGGHAAYGNAVNLLTKQNSTEIAGVGANFFMTYHTILRTSRDYYMALEEARIIALNISAELKLGRNATSSTPPLEVFPYSVFYVFYEQYLTIFSEAAASMFISVATVFLVMLVFSGFDFYTSFLVAVGLCVLLINMAGCMYWFGVSLNAVSLVNIIMSVGIFVEFLSHLAFAFARVDHPDPDHRMVVALVETGTSVLSGITLTKIVGVSVLAFAHSQIFKVFYFRMYLFIIVLGATHGLIWMPVVLSILGGPPTPQLSFPPLKKGDSSSNSSYSSNNNNNSSNHNSNNGTKRTNGTVRPLPPHLQQAPPPLQRSSLPKPLP